MMGLELAAPKVEVHTTQGRGFTPEELAERCADKIVGISDTAPPEIRDQAHAFKGAVKKVVEFYLKEMVHNDRTTVYNALIDAAIRRL